MTIFELSDLIGVNINIIRYPNQSNRWIANLDKCELKEGSCLVSIFCNGDSPESAMIDYLEKISGKIIVIGAFTDNRREINCPVLTIRSSNT